MLLLHGFKCENGVFEADITVPCNTTAVIELPEKDSAVTVGSGSYHFKYDVSMNLEYERYSMESTLCEILENPIALDFLKTHVPDIIDNPMIEFALGQSIAQLLPMMPEGGAALFETAIKVANEVENK